MSKNINPEDDVIEIMDECEPEPYSEPEVSKDIVATNDKAVSFRHEELTFDRLTEMAKMLSKSTIIPVSYQHREENCFVALDLASRMGISPMVVMQNLYVIQGKPSWSGQAIGSMLRTSPAFRNVEVNYIGEPGKDSWGAYVTAEDARTGRMLKGGTVTIAVAKKEGWFDKNGSKWKTMPEIMLAYRAYAWFGRVYAPELMMGLQTQDEVQDVSGRENREKPINPYQKGE